MLANSASIVTAHHRPLILAHRGDSSRAPENTLPAFTGALALGVDYVELDYRHSADGVPMVVHDDTLDRTTDALQRGYLPGTSISVIAAVDLQQLDAGRWFADRFAGSRIPTLAEALMLITPAARCMIERKAGDAATLCQLLLHLGVVDRVAVTAFDWNFLADCRRRLPTLLIGALGEGGCDCSRIATIRKFAGNLVGWRQADVDGQFVSSAHQAGLGVWTWTVDELNRAEQLTGFGVDGLITNAPSRLCERFRSSPEAPPSTRGRNH